MVNQLKVLIVDDETNARKNLQSLLQTYCPQLNIIALAASADEGRVILKNKSIDVIFLDIAMPNENGFDFLNSIDHTLYSIVFVTAYDQYVLKALRASAVDYLQKPIDIDELKAAATKLEIRHQQRINGSSDDDRLQTVNSLKENTRQRKGVQRLCLPGIQGFTVLDVNDIIYLDADSNYTIFHLTSLNKLVVAKSIKEFEDVLDPFSFFRIHKSSIINLKYLIEFSRVDGYYAIMSDKSSVPISRRRLPEFIAAIEAYNK